MDNQIYGSSNVGPEVAMRKGKQSPANKMHKLKHQNCNKLKLIYYH